MNETRCSHGKKVDEGSNHQDRHSAIAVGDFSCEEAHENGRKCENGKEDSLVSDAEMAAEIRNERKHGAGGERREEHHRGRRKGLFVEYIGPAYLEQLPPERNLGNQRFGHLKHYQYRKQGKCR